MTQEAIKALKKKLKSYVEDYPLATNIKLAELFLKENTDIPIGVHSVSRYIASIKAADLSLDEDIADAELGEKLKTFDDMIADDIADAIKELDEVSEKELDSIAGVGGKQIAVTFSEDFDVTNKEIMNDNLIGYSEEEAGEPPADPDMPYSVTTRLEDDIDLNNGATVTRRFVDLIYCGYSNKGLNLTKGELQQVLNASYDEVQGTISKFKIFKDSEPYSKFTNSIMSNTDLFQYVSDNADWMIDRLHKTDGSILTTMVRKYKKELFKALNRDLKEKALFEDLKEALKDVPQINYPESILDDGKFGGKGETFVHLFIPDMHIGLNQSNYNNEVIKAKLASIAADFKEIELPVIIYFMGDIIHSVSGLNHKDNWKAMAQDTSGANAIINPYVLLRDFLSGFNNLYKVMMVGGNHDRLQNDKKAEDTAEGAKIIAYMLNETLSIPVAFDPGMVISDVDPNLRVIIMHGDYPIDKADGQRVAWEYGDSNKFNYILTAHTHSRQQKPNDDGLKFRKETLPAFCPSDDYAKKVAHASAPGYKIALFTDGGLRTTDIMLDYDENPPGTLQD